MQKQHEFSERPSLTWEQAVALFGAGGFAVHPRHIFSNGRELGLAKRLRGVLSSLFAFADDEAETATGSVGQVAGAAGMSVQSTMEHLRYLSAEGYLPTTPALDTGSDQDIRAFDLRPLWAQNARLHLTLAQGHTITTMFSLPFTKWRERDREQRREARRGLRKRDL